MAAECNIARCSQEKRFFRKEFQKWSRNILLVVGFERIAEEFMGKQRWKNFQSPFDNIDDLKPVDWVQDDVCYFCQAKKSPPFDPASGIIPISNEYSSTPIDNGEDSSDKNIFTCGADPSKDQPLDLSLYSTRKPDQLKPTCNGNHVGGGPSDDGEGSDSGISGSNSFLKVPHVPVKSGSKRRFDPNGKKSYTEEELKAALRDIQSGKLGTRRAAVIYGIPRSTLRNKVYKLASDKREQLQRHQHSKIKKTSLDETGISVVNSLKDSEEDAKNGINGISASESLRRLLKQTITLKQQKDLTGTKNSLLNPIPNSLSDERVEGDNETPLSSFKEDKNTEDAFNLSTTTDFNQSISPILTQVLANIQHLALANGAADANDLRDIVADEVHTTCTSFPLLPELIRRLAEERFELERDKMIKKQLEDDFMDCDPVEEDATKKIGDESSVSNSGALSNVILKIPSYRPTKLCSVGSTTKLDLATSNSSTKTLPPHSLRPSTASMENDANVSSQNSSGNNKGITVSLKELIARSINQRLGNSSESECLATDNLVERLNQDQDKINSGNLNYSKDRNVSFIKEEKVSINPISSLVTPKQKSTKDASLPPSKTTNANLNDCGSNQLHKSEKRRRPKRGRYRNYDTDNLAQAVRAVQKGEMSVHRAGTYFGVPHSTLEYKVKERHLLRPKKRENRKISASKSFKNNQQRSGDSQKPYYLRADKISEQDGPSFSGLSPNGLSSSQAEDDELEDDENCDKEMVNGSSVVRNANQLPYSSSTSNLPMPNPLTLWQNMPFFPLDIGLAQVATNGFFASQMMKKLQENVRQQEENLKKKISGYNNSEKDHAKTSSLGNNVGILESLIKSTLEKSIPKNSESEKPKNNNVTLEIPSFTMGSPLTGASLLTSKEHLRKEV